eukprot:SAG11_NODE_2122_length_3784_cov_3.569878_3_plen_117_part_00
MHVPLTAADVVRGPWTDDASFGDARAAAQLRLAAVAGERARAAAEPVEPVLGRDEYWDRPGGAVARELLNMERPESTATLYGRKVELWLESNEIGHRGRPMNPLRGGSAKWRLFAG